ncbi:MAG: helix-turn-helix transcriptional regulator [Treponemataceae bacterium]|nr:MAG: helix-turn-helix transcriptional regulator [Treponemataceae bacterium]
MGFKENLKSELSFNGMLVKELAALSGVNKFSIDNYLNARGQIPSVEAAVKIARALGVSVEYLVTGAEETQCKNTPDSLSPPIRALVRLLDELTEKNRDIVIHTAKELAEKLK